MREEFYAPGVNEPKMLDELRRFVDDLADNRLDDWTTLATTFIDVSIDKDGHAQASLWEFKEEGPISLEK
jgi:hypothetical protein